MKPYLAAALQMTSVPDLDANLAQAEELIDLATRRGAELITLPENFSFLGDEKTKFSHADDICAASEKFIYTMAQRYRITLLGGGYPVPTPQGRTFNRALLVNANGEKLCEYDKVHLFDVNLPDGNKYRESKDVISGSALPRLHASEQFGGLGISVCYDVRFPELYRQLSKEGAEVLIVPAAFTAFTGKDHWKVLLQARAIENTCYVIAPAQTGFHNARRQTHGHAMIVDPWGLTLDDAGESVGMAIAEINPARLAQVRRQMPSLEHRVFG